MQIISTNRLSAIPNVPPYVVVGGGAITIWNIPASSGGGPGPGPDPVLLATPPTFMTDLVASGSSLGTFQSTFDVDIPSGVEDNYLMMVFYTGSNQSRTLTQPSGWHHMATTTDGSSLVAGYFRFAEPGDAGDSVTFNLSGTDDDFVWSLVTYSGVNTTHPFSDLKTYPDTTTSGQFFGEDFVMHIGIPAMIAEYDSQTVCVWGGHNDEIQQLPWLPTSGMDYKFGLGGTTGNLQVSAHFLTQPNYNIGIIPAKTLYRLNGPEPSSAIAFLLNPSVMEKQTLPSGQAYISYYNSRGTSLNNNDATLSLGSGVEAGDLLMFFTNRDGTLFIKDYVDDNLGTRWETVTSGNFIGGNVQAAFSKVAVGGETSARYRITSTEAYGAHVIVIKNVDTSDWLMASGNSAYQVDTYVNRVAALESGYPENPANNCLYLYHFGGESDSQNEFLQCWESFMPAEVSGISMEGTSNIGLLGWAHASGNAVASSGSWNSTWDGNRTASDKYNIIYQIRGLAQEEQPYPEMVNMVNRTDSATLSPTFDLPPYLRPGNLLVAVITSDDADNVLENTLSSPDSTWTFVHAENGVAVFTKILNGEESGSVLFNCIGTATSNWGCTFMQFKDTSRTFPIGRIRVHNQTSETSPIIPALTSTHNALQVAAFVSNGAMPGGSGTGPSGWFTQGVYEIDAGNDYMGVVVKNHFASGTDSAQETWNITQGAGSNISNIRFEIYPHLVTFGTVAEQLLGTPLFGWGLDGAATSIVGDALDLTPNDIGWVSGVYNAGAYYNGSSSSLKANEQAAWSFNSSEDAMLLYMWVRPTTRDNDDDQYLIDVDNATSGMVVKFSASGSLDVLVDGSLAGQISPDSLHEITARDDDEWLQIVVCGRPADDNNNSSEVSYMQVNNASGAYLPLSPTFFAAEDGPSIAVGNSTNTTEPFGGIIDEVVMFKQAGTPEIIHGGIRQALYNNGRGNFYVGTR